MVVGQTKPGSESRGDRERGENLTLVVWLLAYSPIFQSLIGHLPSTGQTIWISELPHFSLPSFSPSFPSLPSLDHPSLVHIFHTFFPILLLNWTFPSLSSLQPSLEPFLSSLPCLNHFIFYLNWTPKYNIDSGMEWVSEWVTVHREILV